MTRLSRVIQRQVPDFINEEFPLFVEFLRDYYKNLEFINNSHDLIENFSLFSDSSFLYSQAEELLLVGNLNETDTEFLVSTKYNIPRSNGLLLIDKELIFYEKAKKSSTLPNTWEIENAIRGYKFQEFIANYSYFSDSQSHSSGTKVINLIYRLRNYFIKKLYESTIKNFVPFERLNKDFIDFSTLFFNYIKYLRSKSTEDSIKFFFRCLFNDLPEIYYPPKQLLRLSDSFYYRKNIIYFSLLNNKFINVGKKGKFIIKNCEYEGLVDSIHSELHPKIQKNNYIYTINLENNKNTLKIPQNFTKLRNFRYFENRNLLFVDSTLGFEKEGKIAVISLKSFILDIFYSQNDENYVEKQLLNTLDYVILDYSSKSHNYFELVDNQNLDKFKELYDNGLEYLYVVDNFDTYLEYENKLYQVFVYPTVQIKNLKENLFSVVRNELKYSIGIPYRQKYHWFLDKINLSAFDLLDKTNIINFLASYDTKDYITLVSSGINNNSYPTSYYYNKDFQFYFTFKKEYTESKLKNNKFIPYVGVTTDGLLIKNHKLPYYEERGKIINATVLNSSDDFIVNNKIVFRIGENLYDDIAIVDGKVVSIIITNPGSGYTQPPYVSLFPILSELEFENAELKAEITNGSVTNIKVIKTGKGFTKVPQVYISPPNDPTGTQAEAFALVIGKLVAIDYKKINDYFYTIPHIELVNGEGLILNPIINNGEIIAVDVINNGVNYYSEPFIQILSTSGKNAFVKTNLINNGRVLSVQVLANGTNYEHSTTELRVVPNGTLASIKLELEKWHYNSGFLVTSYDPFIDENSKLVKIKNQTPNLTTHGKLLGIAADGLPIYENVGYSDPFNPLSSLKEIKSSYQLKSSLAHRPYSTEPLGTFIEDYEYIHNSGDLDEFNARFCVTPEFPNGTWAYFATNNDFPYICNNLKGTFYPQTYEDIDIIKNNGKRIILENYKINPKPLLNFRKKENNKLKEFIIEEEGDNYKIGESVKFNNTEVGYITTLSGKDIIFFERRNNLGIIKTAVPHNLKPNDIITTEVIEYNNIPIYFDSYIEENILRLKLLDGKYFHKKYDTFGNVIETGIIYYGRINQFDFEPNLNKNSLIVLLNNSILSQDDYEILEKGVYIKNATLSDEINIFYIDDLVDYEEYFLNAPTNNINLLFTNCLISINGVIQTNFEIISGQAVFPYNILETEKIQIWYSSKVIKAGYKINSNDIVTYNNNIYMNPSDRNFLLLINKVPQPFSSYSVEKITYNRFKINISSNISSLDEVDLIEFESLSQYKDLDLFYQDTYAYTLLQRGFNYYIYFDHPSHNNKLLEVYDENNKLVSTHNNKLLNLDLRTYQNYDLQHYFLYLDFLKQSLTITESYYKGTFNVILTSSDTIYINFNNIPLYPYAIGNLLKYIVNKSQTAKGGIKKIKILDKDIDYFTTDEFHIESYEGNGAVLIPIFGDAVYDVIHSDSLPYISGHKSLELNVHTLYYVQTKEPLELYQNFPVIINSNINGVCKDTRYVNRNIYGIELYTQEHITFETINNKEIVTVYKNNFFLDIKDDFVSTDYEIKEKQHTLSTGNSYLLADRIYHPHSYTIRTQYNWNKWGAIFKKALHPLGYELVAEQTLDSNLDFYFDLSTLRELSFETKITYEIESEYEREVHRDMPSAPEHDLIASYVFEDEIHSIVDNYYFVKDNLSYNTNPNYSIGSYDSEFCDNITEIKDYLNKVKVKFSTNSSLAIVNNKFMEPSWEPTKDWEYKAQYHPLKGIFKYNNLQQESIIYNQVFYNYGNKPNMFFDKLIPNYKKTKKGGKYYIFEYYNTVSEIPHEMLTIPTKLNNDKRKNSLLLINKVAQDFDNYEVLDNGVKFYSKNEVKNTDLIELITFGDDLYPVRFKIKTNNLNCKKFSIFGYDTFNYHYVYSKYQILLFIDGILQHPNSYELEDGKIVLPEEIGNKNVYGIYFYLPYLIHSAYYVETTANTHKHYILDNYYTEEELQQKFQTFHSYTNINEINIPFLNKVYQHNFSYNSSNNTITIQNVNQFEDLEVLSFDNTNSRIVPHNLVSSNTIEIPSTLTYNSKYNFIIFINGVFQKYESFDISSNLITFQNNLFSTDKIKIYNFDDEIKVLDITSTNSIEYNNLPYNPIYYRTILFSNNLYVNKGLYNITGNSFSTLLNNSVDLYLIEMPYDFVETLFTNKIFNSLLESRYLYVVNNVIQNKYQHYFSNEFLYSLDKIDKGGYIINFLHVFEHNFMRLASFNIEDEEYLIGPVLVNPTITYNNFAVFFNGVFLKSSDYEKIGNYFYIKTSNIPSTYDLTVLSFDSSLSNELFFGNGTTQTFTFSNPNNVPYIVNYNGTLYYRTTFTPTSITFDYPPANGEFIEIYFLNQTSNINFVNVELSPISGNNYQVTHNNNPYVIPNNIAIFTNNILQRLSEINYTSNTSQIEINYGNFNHNSDSVILVELQNVAFHENANVNSINKVFPLTVNGNPLNYNLRRIDLLIGKNNKIIPYWDYKIIQTSLGYDIEFMDAPSPTDNIWIYYVGDWHGYDNNILGDSTNNKAIKISDNVYKMKFNSVTKFNYLRDLSYQYLVTNNGIPLNPNIDYIICGDLIIVNDNIKNTITNLEVRIYVGEISLLNSNYYYHYFFGENDKITNNTRSVGICNNIVSLNSLKTKFLKPISLNKQFNTYNNIKQDNFNYQESYFYNIKNSFYLKFLLTNYNKNILIWDIIYFYTYKQKELLQLLLYLKVLFSSKFTLNEELYFDYQILSQERTLTLNTWLNNYQEYDYEYYDINPFLNKIIRVLITNYTINI
ncbi:MAG: YHYH protein [candidate division WOR-3 bacterium]